MTHEGIAEGWMCWHLTVGSDMVLEHSQVTLMHGHELYYTSGAAYSQIHLSSQNFIYLFVSAICHRGPRVK